MVYLSTKEKLKNNIVYYVGWREGNAPFASHLDPRLF